MPQLAPVWAMGLTQGRLAGLDLARTVVLAVLTAVAALPLGLALAWVLLAVVNVAAFGWRLADAGLSRPTGCGCSLAALAGGGGWRRLMPGAAADAAAAGGAFEGVCQ